VTYGSFHGARGVSALVAELGPDGVSDFSELVRYEPDVAGRLPAVLHSGLYAGGRVTVPASVS
jgi:hypothetical protein